MRGERLGRATSSGVTLAGHASRHPSQLGGVRQRHLAIFFDPAPSAQAILGFTATHDPALRFTLTSSGTRNDSATESRASTHARSCEWLSPSSSSAALRRAIWRRSNSRTSNPLSPRRARARPGRTCQDGSAPGRHGHLVVRSRRAGPVACAHPGVAEGEEQLDAIGLGENGGLGQFDGAREVTRRFLNRRAFQGPAGRSRRAMGEPQASRGSRLCIGPAPYFSASPDLG